MASPAEEGTPSHLHTWPTGVPPLPKSPALMRQVALAPRHVAPPKVKRRHSSMEHGDQTFWTATGDHSEGKPVLQLLSYLGRRRVYVASARGLYQQVVSFLYMFRSKIYKNNQLLWIVPRSKTPTPLPPHRPLSHSRPSFRRAQFVF